MSKKLTQSSLMQHLMDHIRDNIYFMDREGRIILINEEGARWLGYESPQELVGKTDLDLFTNEHGVAAFEDEQRIMASGVPILGKEEKETRLDGRVTWVSTSKMPLRDDEGDIVGTFGISRDITEHKEAEIRAEKLAEENRSFREEMEVELSMAAELQKTFFPTSYPEFEVEQGIAPVEFCHIHHAGGMMGGDFCSVRKLSDTKVGVLLCDVMGHGVRAALGTAIVRTIVEEISEKELDPGRYLEHMNRALYPILRQGEQFLFATACYMVLDVSTGTLRCAMAGHPSPVRFNDARSDWLVGPDVPIGPALAIVKDASYPSHEYTLQPGDSVLMYTDGIYEVVNSRDEEFGQERLLQTVSCFCKRPLNDLFAGLLGESSKFSDKGKLDDDACLVGFRFNQCL